uniref:Uncharacterized protein n=1 Tax=Anopheles culicifacies TaxID=139723 RepID=A0A182MKA7_9DIPT
MEYSTVCIIVDHKYKRQDEKEKPKFIPHNDTCHLTMGWNGTCKDGVYTVDDEPIGFIGFPNISQSLCRLSPGIYRQPGWPEYGSFVSKVSGSLRRDSLTVHTSPRCCRHLVDSILVAKPWCVFFVRIFL